MPERLVVAGKSNLPVNALPGVRVDAFCSYPVGTRVSANRACEQLWGIRAERPCPIGALKIAQGQSARLWPTPVVRALEALGLIAVECCALVFPRVARLGCVRVNARVLYRATTPRRLFDYRVSKKPLKSPSAVGLFAALSFLEALIAKGSHIDDKRRRSSMNGGRKWLLSPAD
jgi:hypothetical protein